MLAAPPSGTERLTTWYVMCAHYFTLALSTTAVQLYGSKALCSLECSCLDLHALLLDDPNVLSIEQIAFAIASAAWPKIFR